VSLSRPSINVRQLIVRSIKFAVLKLSMSENCCLLRAAGDNGVHCGTDHNLVYMAINEDAIGKIFCSASGMSVSSLLYTLPCGWHIDVATAATRGRATLRDPF